MIGGETVTVLTREQVGRDGMNAPVWSTGELPVDGVLVAPGGTSDIDGSTRPSALSVTLTLHFPKGFSMSMRGLQVRVRGEVYSVVGDPKPYTPDNVPGRWWYPVEVVRHDG